MCIQQKQSLTFGSFLWLWICSLILSHEAGASTVSHSSQMDHVIGRGNTETLQYVELLSHVLGETGCMNCIFNDNFNVGYTYWNPDPP